MLNANLVTQFSGEVMFKNKRKKWIALNPQSQ